VLYLLEPNAQLRWCNLPADTILEAAAAHDVDLARLEWQPAEEFTPDATTLALALRYGTPCSRGLVLNACYVDLQRRAAEIRAAHAASTQSQAALGDFHRVMEQWSPGSTEARRERDAGIDDGSARLAADADAKLQRALTERDIDPRLQAHWEALGGHVPGETG
jgi:hypothetical protein